MKNVTLLAFMLCLLGVNSYAQKSITVDNKITSPADYSDLQTALDEADPGDTVYVAGSPDTYGDIHIKKSVVLIGQGFQPYLQNGDKTNVGEVYLYNKVSLNYNSSNSEIRGFEISQIIGYGANHVDSGKYIENIILERNNVDRNFYLDNAKNWFVKHNVLEGRIYCPRNNSDLTAKLPLNVSITNNLYFNYYLDFYGVSNVFSYNTVAVTGYFYTDKAIIENNIFYSAHVENFNSSKLYNNVFDQSTEFPITAVTSSNLLLEAVAYGFANLEGGISFYDDLHINDDSPLKTLASDGGEVGMYGGLDPFPESTKSNVPNAIQVGGPEVQVMQILNYKVPQDGTLKVKVKAKSYE